MGENSVKTYVGSLSVFALFLLASWVYWYGFPLGLNFVLAAVVFGVLLCSARVFPITWYTLGKGMDIDASDVVFVGSVVLMGPTWAALAALPHAILTGRGNLLRTGFEIAQNTIMVYLMALVFSVVSGPLLVESPAAVALVVFATLASAVTFAVVNNTINAGLLKVKHLQSFKETWAQDIEPYLLSDAINVLTAGVGVLALLVYGPVAGIVVVAGSTVSQVIVFRSRDKVAENAELRERISSLEKSLEISNLTFGTMMLEDLGRRDGYMHLHAAATSAYAGDIGRELKLEERTVELLRMAGLLHNIGMFGLPDEILTATGTLNSIAKGRISEHPIMGESALASVPEFEELATWVRWHHERPDGRGFPDRLRGPWIPIEARVLSAAQAYAAMVLDQPRRPGMSFAAAREELNGGAGTQFDEVVARAFLRILDTESEGYRMADDYRFVFPAARKQPTTPPRLQEGEKLDGFPE